MRNLNELTTKDLTWLDGVIKEKWDEIVKDKSLQEYYTPSWLVIDMIKNINIHKDMDILVMGNLDIYALLNKLKSTGWIDFKSIRVVTDIFREGNPNIITTNLTKIKNLKLDMKFDLIIGNPPFHHNEKKSDHSKLWMEFIIHSRKLLVDSGYLSLLVPPTYYNISRHGKKTIGVSTSTFNLVYYKYLGECFPGVGTKACFFIEKNEPYTGKTEYNGKTYDLRYELLLDGVDKIKQDIIDKVINYNPKHDLVFNWFDKDKIVEDGNIEVYISGLKKGRTNVELPHTNKWKLVLPFSSSYKKQFVTQDAVGHLNNYILLDSKQQGENILSYTLSKLFIFVANNFMKSSGFTPFARNKNIPLLENKIWDDKSIYHYFNLTSEEIQLIENTIK